ncbi:hypothetical protein BN948_05059 [Hydrogenophaga intermedia]|uniref:Uncharacterized protein n=1 Tax=Hydrogenophaga intermedia TaxID=65786 RepID=A0A1L1PPB9_HYDIT|nr:hypothetical protein [Hydrogenophaga intermedia]CDN90614.1 hypothetical protein BN948_05059 [Hydrogenophaga intermedia]
MSRLQISDDFGAQRLVTQARPIAQTQAVPSADQRFAGLANAFAAAEMLNETNRQRVEREETANAQRWANSMTVDELGKRIRSGEMLPSQSPVFAATAQNIWGQNALASLERDVTSKVNTGEVTFSSSEEVERYLVEARNTALAGQSKYAAAGYDQRFNGLRERLMSGVAQANDKVIVEQAANDAADNLGNTLNRVTAGDYTGSTQDAVKEVMDQYHLLRKTSVMPPAAARGALLETITRAAASGKTELVTGLLETQLPDIGSVRSMLGADKAATLEAQAGTRYDGLQRQRVDEESLPFYLAASDGQLQVEKFMGWATSDTNKKYTTAAFINGMLQSNMAAQARAAEGLRKARLQGAIAGMEHEAQKRVDAALSQGRLWDVQGTNTPQVMTSTGTLKDFDVKGYAEQALVRKTADMAFDQQVSAWSLNGLVNPNWANQLRAGLNNLASIALDSKGKPLGELNEAGLQAIELFKQLNNVSPDAARQTAGEDAFKRFSDIAFLEHMGRAPADAAAIASSAASGASAGSPAYKLETKIAARVAELTDTPWMDWLENKRDGAWDVIRRNNPLALGNALAAGLLEARGQEVPEWLESDPVGTTRHNTTPNTSQVSGWVRRHATLLAHSGHAPDADTALSLAVEYVSDPKVSVKVNGTLYLRHELPSAPGEGEDAAQWLGRFLDEVPKARALEQGFAASEVRLEFDERSRVYRAFMGGLPMSSPEGGVWVFSRGDIERWMREQRQEDIEKAAPEAAYESFKARINAEIPEVQKGDRYAIERYDKSLYGRGFDVSVQSAHLESRGGS